MSPVRYLPTTDQSQPPADAGVLSRDELISLARYKWRYAFESLGFPSKQVQSLVFLKWLHATQRVTP